MSKKLLSLTLSLFFVVTITQAENLLYIKYRPTPVDVDKPYFEFLDTSGSSLVTGAWYDSSHTYMIIGLQGVNYHYCGVDSGTWKTFKGADSFGKSYNQLFKGRFDCRITPPPEY